MIDFTTITITEAIQTVIVSVILYVAIEMIINTPKRSGKSDRKL